MSSSLQPPASGLNVLLIEPYFSGSHRAWAEGYQRHSTHDVRLLTLPGRFWKWRMFGGAVSLAEQARDAVASDGPPDVIVASDMLDLPSFLGHAGPALSSATTVLYLHENQLTYPLSPTARDDLAYAYMNWSSMLRADEIWFNSQFHLDAVFDALPKFLRHFPDHRHVQYMEAVREKAVVIPVGVELGWVGETEKHDPPLIVWNQRWEYDKDPERLFRALYRLADTTEEFRLALCGENFRNVPVEFEEARRRLHRELVHYGYADRPAYEALLGDASVVVSTAKHEFFGIAAVEAMAAGAVPVFPHKLSYPELVPPEVHPDTLYNDNAGLDDLLRAAVTDPERRDRIRSAVAPSMSRFSWEDVAPAYDRRVMSDV